MEADIPLPRMAEEIIKDDSTEVLVGVTHMFPAQTDYTAVIIPVKRKKCGPVKSKTALIVGAVLLGSCGLVALLWVIYTTITADGHQKDYNPYDGVFISG